MPNKKLFLLLTIFYLGTYSSISSASDATDKLDMLKQKVDFYRPLVIDGYKLATSYFMKREMDALMTVHLPNGRCDNPSSEAVSRLIKKGVKLTRFTRGNKYYCVVKVPNVTRNRCLGLIDMYSKQKEIEITIVNGNAFNEEFPKTEIAKACAKKKKKWLVMNAKNNTVTLHYRQNLN
jgi:hypothetical protein